MAKRRITLTTTLLAALVVSASSSVNAQSSPNGSTLAVSAGAGSTTAAIEIFVDAKDVKREFETVFSADPNEESRASEQNRVSSAKEMAVATGADAVIIGQADRAPDMGPEFKGLQKRLQPGSVVGIKYKPEPEKKGKKKK